MRREGSAFQGLGVVVLKELSDHLTGIRMVIIEWLVVLLAAFAVYKGIAPHDVREASSEDPFLLLHLFTKSGEGLPSFLSFVSLVSILVPLVAICLGFDLVNSEHNQRTLSRILSQPIYRDALLFGKFLAGLATLAIMLVSLWLMVIGLGILMLGVPPGGEEVARAGAMLGVTIVYAGVWLGLALLLSVVFRSAASALIVGLGLWFFLTLIWPVLSPFVAALFVSDARSLSDVLNQLSVYQAFARLSPGALFGEIVGVLMDPTVQSTQQPLLASIGLMLVQPGAIPMQPLPLSQSLLIVWPQTVAMIAAVIMLFVIGYVIFQRQEVRA